MWLVALFFLRFLIIAKVYAENLDPEPNIVGGHDVLPGERPFQVSLQKPYHFCGGSIIDRNYIVTAAHCMDGEQASKIKVVVGTVDLRRPYKSYQASKIIIHENFQPDNSYRNDIALIKVNTPIQFNTYVQPVLLNTNNNVPATNTSVTVSGWGGLVGPNSPTPDRLQEVTIKVDDLEHCQLVMRRDGNDIFDSQLCAYNSKVRKGHCSGDSGGPLTYNNNLLVGIVSWSVKDPDCASTHYPNVYTRVSKFYNWIQKKKR